MIKCLRIKETILIMVFVCCVFSFLGCTTTIHEDRPLQNNEGSVTQLKVDPQKIKLVHDF